MKMDMHEEVRDFIVRTFMKSRGTLSDDQSLFENNIVDSFGLLEIISFVEQKYRVRIGPGDAVIRNFDSVDAIVRFIRSRL